MDKPDNYSRKPPFLLRDTQLVETWRYIKYLDEKEDRGIRTFGGGFFETDARYPSRRRRALEQEMQNRGMWDDHKS